MSWGDAPALVDPSHGTVSYKSLAAQADAFAETLGPDVRLLGLCIAPELEAVAAYLGALRAGVPVVLLSGAASLSSVLDACPPDAVFAYDDVKGTWALDRRPTPWRSLPHPDLRVLLSTSGSTGRAKLVKLSGDNLQANATSIAAYLALGPQERGITSLPLSYSYGLSILNKHLAVGASVVLTSASVADPDFRAIVEAEGVTSLSGVPYSYELMDRSGLLAALPTGIRTLTQAGGRMAPEMISRVARQAAAQGASLIVMYGQTEATARIAYLPADQLEANPGAIGGPIPGGELWVEDSDGARLKPGEEGELVYRGPNVMMGYAEGRDDLATPQGPDILRTGDLAVQTGPRMFKITGRMARFVKPYGLRIGLDELEGRFREAGADALATGSDDLIVAMGAADSEAIVRGVFADLALPDDLLEFVVGTEPPRLASGKPDMAEILRLGRAQRQAIATTSDIAEVERLFRRIARVSALDGSETFQDLGGDSLSYVQCSLAIEEAIGELPSNWEAVSLNELRRLAAARPAPVSGARRGMTIEADVLVRAGAILVILLNHGLGGLSGGADILLMLAGYSWSRFQLPRLARNGGREVFGDFARRYLIFYLVVILGMSALNHRLSVSHLTFTSTFVHDWGGILNTYWFIETLAWCVGTVCVVASVPPLRRLMGARPLAFGLGFVAVALAIRVGGSSVLDSAADAFRSPDQMLVYFAAGWTIAQSRWPFRAALLGLLVTLSGLAWGWTDTHVVGMALASAVMLLGRVVVPFVLGRVVTLIAAASFFIYLVNPLPMYVTDQILHAQYGPYWLFQVVATLGAGLAIYLSIEVLRRGVEAGLTWREPGILWDRLSRIGCSKRLNG